MINGERLCIILRSMHPVVFHVVTSAVFFGLCVESCHCTLLTVKKNPTPSPLLSFSTLSSICTEKTGVAIGLCPFCWSSFWNTNSSILSLLHSSRCNRKSFGEKMATVNCIIITLEMCRCEIYTTHDAMECMRQLRCVSVVQWIGRERNDNPAN